MNNNYKEFKKGEWLVMPWISQLSGWIQLALQIVFGGFLQY